MNSTLLSWGRRGEGYVFSTTVLLHWHDRGHFGFLHRNGDIRRGEITHRTFRKHQSIAKKGPLARWISLTRGGGEKHQRAVHGSGDGNSQYHSIYCYKSNRSIAVLVQGTDCTVCNFLFIKEPPPVARYCLYNRRCRGVRANSSWPATRVVASYSSPLR